MPWVFFPLTQLQPLLVPCFSRNPNWYLYNKLEEFRKNICCTLYVKKKLLLFSDNKLSWWSISYLRNILFKLLRKTLHVFSLNELGSFLYFIYNLLLYLIKIFIPSVKHGLRFRYFCSTENVLTGKQSLYIFINFLWNILCPCWHSLHDIILF